MNVGTTLAACVLISVTTSLGPTNVAAPQASSWPVMAEIAMVSKFNAYHKYEWLNYQGTKQLTVKPFRFDQ